jgi:predicted nicotinamide N-methyase
VNRALFHNVELEGRPFRRINLDHPEVEARILREMDRGVAVYYDRHWPFTQRVSAHLLRNPHLVAGRRVMVLGAGVGLEAVVVGSLAARLWINDLAPAALELQALQLEANGIQEVEVLAGSFGELDWPEEVEVILGCFVLYDEETAAAMEALLERARTRDTPVILADLDVGGHFTGLLARSPAPVRWLTGTDHPPEPGPAFRIARVG